MIELSRRLDRRRFEVHLACFRREGAWLPRAEEGSASIVEFPIEGFRRRSTLAQMRAFARWCRATGVDILHTTDLYANVFGLPAAAAAGVPVRIGNRRELNPDKSLGLVALQRAAYGCAHRIAANSHAAANRLRRELVPAGKVVVIPNGLDLGAFAPRRPRPRVRRVITVANLRQEKAHEVLLAAAAVVLARYSDAEFWIVGDGARYQELTDLAARSGLSGRVRFLGHREDVPALLAESDAFVLPSRSEAFPGGLMEAMAAGLPVVATAVGGNRELVRHGENGLLVPPGDAEAIVSALLELMASPERAAGLGEAARASVEDRFSFERMVSTFENLYQSEYERSASLAAERGGTERGGRHAPAVDRGALRTAEGQGSTRL